RVEARPGYAHGLGQVSQRGALVTLLPEHAQRRRQCRLDIELAGTSPSSSDRFHIIQYIMLVDAIAKPRRGAPGRELGGGTCRQNLPPPSLVSRPCCCGLRSLDL